MESQSFADDIQLQASVPPLNIHVVCGCEISFASSARNLGFLITDDMSLDLHIKNTCRSAYFELSRLGTIRHLLSVDFEENVCTSHPPPPSPPTPWKIHLPPPLLRIINPPARPDLNSGRCRLWCVDKFPFNRLWCVDMFPFSGLWCGDMFPFSRLRYV